MFSFRRKPKKEAATVPLRRRPSLPELNNQGIPWPENLVDVTAIRETSALDDSQAYYKYQGAVKSSLPWDSGSPIAFHKPFRDFTGKVSDGGPISSLYMSSPPSAFENSRKGKPASVAGRYSQRRARNPPTFNVMVSRHRAVVGIVVYDALQVVGGKGTGKTSLLRLLVETADISPTANEEQRRTVSEFLSKGSGATETLSCVSVEISESRFDRVLLSVIDTPGLDFRRGRELKLERQVNDVIKHIDAQYAETMAEESKVVRKSRGDQHIHLAIYLIDPASVLSRPDSPSPYTPPPELVEDTSSAEDSLEHHNDDDRAALSMSPAEIRVIRRLADRSNVLPVIAHADSLTDERLHAIKNAVRRDLSRAGISFGVFVPSGVSPLKSQPRRVDSEGENGNGHAEHAEPRNSQEAQPNNDAEDEERQSRPVIKLRPTRHRPLSRSRSRRDLSQAADDDHRPMSPDPGDTDSVANVRFSAHILAKTDLNALLPFALIAPEPGRQRKRQFASDTPVVSSPTQQSEDGHTVPQTPVSTHGPHIPYLQGPPDDLKGIFVRKFRWGTIDVLDPNHCDFAALRTAILSTHLKLLKVHTKEVLYEKYRTEKLLARRATQHISEEERNRLFQDLGL